MGIYSTLNITREDVIVRIQNLLDKASNQELEEALFALTCNHTYDNYVIMTEEEIIKFDEEKERNYKEMLKLSKKIYDLT